MDFAFLIHSRDYTDVQRKFKIAKFLPKSWVEFWCLHWPPIIVSKITGLVDNNGKEAKGWLIGIPMTAKQMIENRNLAIKKVTQAVKKAEKLGQKGTTPINEIFIPNGFDKPESEIPWEEMVVFWEHDKT